MKKANVSADAAAMGGDAASGTEYHVFLSFIGADTRSGFIDRLSRGLADAGILVFKDEEEIRVGAEIGWEILRGIDSVQICIPIFSKSYASSKRCLKELAAMVESKVKSGGGKTILPIFYDVEPRDVRLKTPLYRDALLEHKKRLGSDKVRVWEDALGEVGSFSGWAMGSSSLSRGVGGLVKLITAKLKVNCVDVDKYFVRSDQVDAITDLLAIDVGVLGIHGLGGIGKIAVSKAAFNYFRYRFQGCSFLEVVRELSQRHGLVKLQKLLLSDILYPRADYPIANADEGRNMIMKKLSAKKVLIILDDVDHAEQIRQLIGQHDGFGSGSRIIVTTRKRSVLKLENQTVAYEMQEMTHDHALQLFSRHAFERDSPPDNYKDF
ncbi:TMV resistance protein N-like [Eucalyptus grandis]|uniref:TMV resistance protein N-like n=1 Tax=Eucalyptus grandis TaxID=71139 RepID=UPI00192EF372|nr:TMV resistance protein N-like [Eucalyptus grandis]